tara:strand:+ start:302 stop:496 length:195 start_codon:yes stop_codon:yes gene_type:complete
MLHTSIQWGGDTWELAIDYNSDATITSTRFERHGTFCGELLHDFVGRNYVPAAVLTLLLEELNR